MKPSSREALMGASTFKLNFKLATNSPSVSTPP